MQKQGSPFSDLSPAILVASGPQDERAIALVQTLREAGLRVTFADTVTLATRAADEGTACVAVLRPDTWKTQTIATVMRAKPACLIPVLAEALDLPRDPWTKPAIDLSTPNEAGEQELIQMLRDYLATYAVSAQITSKNDPLFVPNVLQFKRRNRRRLNVGALVTTIVLILLIAGLGGLLVYRYFTHPSTVPVGANNALSLSHPIVYNAAIPGPNCSVGYDQWETGGYYIKTVNKKQVEVLDKYTTLQCQPNGALITRNGDYSVYSELFFNGPTGPASLASHYFAQVNATMLSGDAQANVTIEAHLQTDKYGRYNFDINTAGHWEASIGNASDGSRIKNMAIGFLPKAAKTYTLALDVNGPTMTFFIDGIQVTSVTDTTYTDNNFLAFGIGDSTASSPVSALFSNFQYKALPATLTSEQAVATATALTRSTMQTPYTARVPGYTCDKGAGQWQPIADTTDNPGVIHCQTGGMQLTNPPNAKTIAEEDFYWLNGQFPQNYKVSARIDVSAANNGCAGLGTRENDTGNTYGSYNFVICSDGSWAIALTTDKFHTLAQGTVDPQNVYTITAESNGSAQSLYINGQLVKTVNDTSLTGTDYLSLDAGFYTSNQTISATFSNFTFTPLP